MNDYTPEQWAAIERAVNKLETYLEAQEKVQEVQRQAIAAYEATNDLYKDELHNQTIEREARTA